MYLRAKDVNQDIVAAMLAGRLSTHCANVPSCSIPDTPAFAQCWSAPFMQYEQVEHVSAIHLTPTAWPTLTAVSVPSARARTSAGWEGQSLLAL